MAPAASAALPAPLGERPRPSWRLRARVWINATELDRALAEGAHPPSSAALALRSGQLARPRDRARLADALERMVSAAQEPLPYLPRPLFARRAVLDAAGELLALAERLRSPAAARPHVLALASYLVTCGTSPLYLTSSPASAAQLARAACAGFADLPPASSAGRARA